jgi:hypothetical protein
MRELMWVAARQEWQELLEKEEAWDLKINGMSLMCLNGHRRISYITNSFEAAEKDPR